MNNTPAWLSAAVAFMAFTSTTILAVSNRFRDRRNEKREAYAIALAIAPDLLRLRSEIGPIGAKLDLLRPRIEGADGVLSDSTLEEALRAAKIPIPYLLERNIDRLAKLGPIEGRACLESISTLTHYQRNIAGMTEALAAGEFIHGASAMINLYSMLRMLAEDTHKAVDLVESRYKVFSTHTSSKVK